MYNDDECVHLSPLPQNPANGIAASIVGHRQWLPGLDQQLHSHSLSPSTMQHCS